MVFLVSCHDVSTLFNMPCDLCGDTEAPLVACEACSDRQDLTTKALLVAYQHVSTDNEALRNQRQIWNVHHCEVIFSFDTFSKAQSFLLKLCEGDIDDRNVSQIMKLTPDSVNWYSSDTLPHTGIPNTTFQKAIFVDDVENKTPIQIYTEATDTLGW